MTIDHKISDQKVQYVIIREAAKISALLSGKSDKYQYLTVEEILSSYQRQIIEQNKFAYFLLRKAFEKQTEKQVGSLDSLDLSNKKDELKEIESIFLQNLMNGLVHAKLKEIKKSLICKILLKRISYIINQNVEKYLFLMNIPCLLLF